MLFTVMGSSMILHYYYIMFLGNSNYYYGGGGVAGGGGGMRKNSSVITALAILLTLLLTSQCQGIGSTSLQQQQTHQQHQLQHQQQHHFHRSREQRSLVTGVSRTVPASLAGGGITVGDGDLDDEETLDPATMPYFDYSVPRNISTIVGQHAFLLCRVYRMKDKAVSWIRKRDLHILTAGIYTYTTDQRFVVLHPEKSENWTLQIKYPQERDAGVYECQVNTEPKISMAFHLTVIESRATITGGSDIYVQSGSSLRLTCEVEHGPHDIAQVFWYHGSKLLDPQGIYGEPPVSDIRVVTQRDTLLRSQLTILKVRSHHSGNYTCNPTMSAPASVIVHVISEHPAAMKKGNRSSSSHTQLRYFEYFLIYAFLYLISRVHVHMMLSHHNLQLHASIISNPAISSSSIGFSSLSTPTWSTS